MNSIKNFVEKPNSPIYESLYRIFALLDRQNINIELEDILIELINNAIKESKSYFYDSGSYRRNHIFNRFRKINELFTKYLNKELEIKPEEITNKNSDTIIKLDTKFEVNNPSPVNKSIHVLLKENDKNKIDLRPVYQRGEVITNITSSRIIESILLGIQLPSIFTFKRNNGISEVIDGQQRLTAIFSFIGQELSIKGKKEKSKKHQFALKGLTILEELNGKTFEDLDEKLKDKIYDFKISVFEIKEEFNPNFNPIEMFIRLNYKPYPISQNSFELWNSYINKDLIDKIKDSFQKDKDWFFVYSKDSKASKRMGNEDFITSILFLEYIQKEYVDLTDIVSYTYNGEEKISSISLRTKNRVTKILLELENTPNEYKKLFTNLNHFKSKLKALLIQQETDNFQEEIRKNLSEVTNINQRKKTQFYLLWLLLKQLNISILQEHKVEIFNEIKEFFLKSKISQGFESKEDLKNKINEFWEKYKIDKRIIKLSEDEKKEMIINQETICPLCQNDLFYGQDIHVDHIMPISKGGNDTIENLQIVHASCNLKKGNQVK